MHIFTNLHVMNNSSSTSIGVGGTPRAPLAPPFIDDTTPTAPKEKVRHGRQATNRSGMDNSSVTTYCDILGRKCCQLARTGKLRGMYLSSDPEISRRVQVGF